MEGLGHEKRLQTVKPTENLWSSSSIFLSVANLLSVVFLDLEVQGLSFFAFFSGTAAGGDEIDSLSPTAPITETVDGSTKVPSLIGVEELSNFFSFFSLYEGVASWAFCSGVKTMQNLHSMSGVSTHGSFPFPLSQQRAEKECPSKLTIVWPQFPLFCPGEDMLNNNICLSIKQDHCRGVYLPPSIKREEIPFPRYSQFFIFR